MLAMFFPGALAEEAAQEAQPSWFQTAFGDFSAQPWWVWALMVLLLAGGLALYSAKKGGGKSAWNVKMVALGAVCMALSNVLSLIKLWEMPQGGSVTAASMLPMMLFAYVYGAGPGLLLGAVYGVMQFLIEPYFLSVPQMLLDYPVGFAMVGLAGAFSKAKNESAGLCAGVLLGSVGRFIASVLSGVFFFAEYAGDQNPWIYSVVYNGTYMLPECVICVVLCLTAGARLVRQLRRVK